VDAVIGQNLLRHFLAYEGIERLAIGYRAELSLHSANKLLRMSDKAPSEESVKLLCGLISKVLNVTHCLQIESHAPTFFNFVTPSSDAKKQRSPSPRSLARTAVSFLIYHVAIFFFDP
jgi:hypothetical protein